MPDRTSTTCATCAAEFQYRKRGRPRRYCDTCRDAPRPTTWTCKGCTATRTQGDGQPLWTDWCPTCPADTAPAPRTCDHCDITFTPTSNDPRIRFCSDRCRYTHKNRRPDRNQTNVPGNCVTCGGHFTGSPNRSYCSALCRWLSNSPSTSSRVPWSTCNACSAWFVARSRKSFCSSDCASSAERLARRNIRFSTCSGCGNLIDNTQQGPARQHCDAWCARDANTAELNITGCERCNHAFLTYGWQKFCSDECRPHYNHRLPDATRDYVFRRDNFRCLICGTKCRTDVHWSHRLAPTVDHIVPRIQGGPDHPKNLRCAHRSCNSSKGARATGDQLLLIG